LTSIFSLFCYKLYTTVTWKNQAYPLSGCDLSIAAGVGMIVFVVMEVEKWFKREK